MAGGLFNGRKTVKKLLSVFGLTQRAYAQKIGMEETYIAIRLSRNFYDKPGNLARFVDDLGLILDVQIIAKVKDQEGNVICDVPINQDFMDEE